MAFVHDFLPKLGRLIHGVCSVQQWVRGWVAQAGPTNDAWNGGQEAVAEGFSSWLPLSVSITPDERYVWRKRWTGSFRAAWLQLKISNLLQVIRRPLGNLPLHKIVVHSHSLGRVAIPDWSQAKGDTHVSVKSSQVQIIACPLFGANTLRPR